MFAACSETHRRFQGARCTPSIPPVGLFLEPGAEAEASSPWCSPAGPGLLPHCNFPQLLGDTLNPGGALASQAEGARFPSSPLSWPPGEDRGQGSPTLFLDRASEAQKPAGCEREDGTGDSETWLSLHQPVLPNHRGVRPVGKQPSATGGRGPARRLGSCWSHFQQIFIEYLSSTSH